MSNSENPVPFFYPVTTADQLVEQLTNNPPDIFQHTTLPLLDNRDSSQPNLFTFAVLGDQVKTLMARYFLGDENFSYSLDKGETSQFGLTFGTHVQTLKEVSGEIRAQRTIYVPLQRKVFFKRNRYFCPVERYMLSGEDHRQTPFQMEVTRYRRGNEEEVDVYKITNGKGTDARSLVMVGRPTWDTTTQRGIARGLRIKQY